MRRIFLALSLFLGLAASALAYELPERQCTTATGLAFSCPSDDPFSAITIGPFDAVRSDIGQAGTPIDVWDRCRYVDNDSGDTSFFVPFKSNLEWFSFISGAPSSLSLVTCARPTSANLVPNSDCLDPSPAAQPVSLPYARTGTVLPKSATFTCAPAEEDCPSWTQTVEANFTALNSDVVNPSWAEGALNYSGEAPTCSVDGACGPAHGTPVISAPTSGLCDTGEASSVSGSGPWTWSCGGTGTGSDALCAAAISPQDGECGPADGVEVSEAPSSGLCTTGTASALSGTGPWTWSCAGIGGAPDASCDAPITPAACPIPATKTAKLPFARYRHGCATHPATGKIYCFGGRDAAFNLLNQVIEYDPAADTMVTKSATLPSAREWFQCAANPATGKIYCFGGAHADANWALTQIIEYNPATNAMVTKSATLPSGGVGQSCVFSSSTSKFYCFGGYNGAISSQIVEYNPATDTRTVKGASLPFGLYMLECAASPETGKIYCFGGRKEGGIVPSTQIFEYSPSTDTLVTKAAVLPDDQDSLSCTSGAGTGKIYCLGGENSTAMIGQTLEYTPATDTLVVRCEAVYNQPCVTNPNTGYVYCLGGYVMDDIKEFHP